MKKTIWIIVACLFLGAGGFFAKIKMDAKAKLNAEKGLNAATAELRANLDSERRQVFASPEYWANLLDPVAESHARQLTRLLAAQEEARRLGHRDTADLNFQTGELKNLLAAQRMEWQVESQGG